jgi:hypothetical protein
MKDKIITGVAYAILFIGCSIGAGVIIVVNAISHIIFP